MVLEDDAWRLGPPVSMGYPYEVEAAGWTQAQFVDAITVAQTMGVRPFPRRKPKEQSR